MRIQISLIEAEFLRYKSLGEGAMAQVTPEQLVEGSATASSIATLTWHISGNLTSRFTDLLSSDGEKPWRDRETEFESRDVSRAHIVEKWGIGWGVLLQTLSTLNDEDLSRIVTIRSVEHRVDQALLRSMAHTSYHVGQIVFLAKRFSGDAWTSLSIPPGESEAYRIPPT